MSEENSENHQDYNKNGDLEDENLDSELGNSHAIRSAGGNDLEEIDSLNDTELPEDEEIEVPIEEIKDDNYYQNSSNTSELSTTDNLSTCSNEDHFKLNSNNYISDESSNFVTNDQSENEIAKKEEEIRDQLDLNLDQPLLDEFFDLGESPIIPNNTVQLSQQELSMDNSERIVDESSGSLIYTNTSEEVDYFWSGRIVKGGGGNTGFVTFPKGMVQDSDLNHGDRVKLRFHNEAISKDISVDTQFRTTKQRSGFYIPKNIMAEHDLMGNNYNFTANKEEGFATKISAHKQVIIPENKLKEFQISDNDIINFQVETEDGTVVKESVIVKYNDRSDRRGEHIAVFRTNDVNAGVAEALIESKLEKTTFDPLQSSEGTLFLSSLFPKSHIGKLDDDTGILFQGNYVPIEVPLEIDVEKTAHYMGCYFADGTKQGHAWRMSASTPEQVMYYNSIYDRLLPNEEFIYNVVYSKTPSDSRTKEKIDKDIRRYWEENTNNSININKVYQVDATKDDAPNRNEYGSLQIDNHKGLVMQLHQQMLDQTMRVINESDDKDLLWKFIHGILEGDGYVARGSERFGLGISCNVDNYEFIQRILDKFGIQYSTDTYPLDNGLSEGVKIEFGLFEILKNFSDIKDTTFQFYPKRANRLFDRMQQQSTVQHILGNESDSNFVKGRSKEFDRYEIIKFFENRES